MLALANTEEAQDMTMAKDIAETLFEKYPGYMWGVNVKSGVAIIKCLNVSSLYGYILKYADIKDDAGYRKKEVIRAGGEILERANLARGERVKYNTAQAVDGIKDYNPLFGVR
jgi:hypothetical protein